MVAALLADEVERPVLVLDERGTIRLVNCAAEAALGWERTALLDRALEAIMPGDRPPEQVRGLLVDARDGARQRAELTVLTPAGERLVLRTRITVVRGGDEVVIVCEVEGTRREREVVAWPEAWLDVSIEDFGRIERGRGYLAQDVVGRRCHEVVVGQESACPNCPIRHLPVGGVVHDVEILADDRTLVRRAVRTSQWTARVAHSILDPRLVREVFDARLKAVADRCALSEREREVLAELVRGRGLEDIADLLRISERTVRFHQANVLAKLGVDSRLELVRILIA